MAPEFWEKYDCSRAAEPHECHRPSRPLGSILLARSALALILLALLSTFTVAETGADVYKTRCSACHGATGAGDTMLGRNLKIRPLASDDVQKQSDDELATVIGKGRNKMPPYDRKLSKDQIAEVVKYIRSLKKY
ncbi:MAG: cytochrome c [Terriglobales bacterium]|jgi:mono/diheme cytochrome c family protein